MMHRVASRLNEWKWTDVLDTVEEFVVVSTDRIGSWLVQDLKDSVPPKKFDMLQRRGKLFDAE